MKIYPLVLGAVALIGLGLMLYSNSRKLPSDQAGVAYTETDDGELVLNEGQRTNSKAVLGDSDNGSASEEWLSKFVLTERSGEQLGSAQLEGTPYVAGFFFSTCPSICVQQNGKVKELQDKYRGQSVRFLSISVDPEVDTPEQLTEYAKRFDADADQWLFLTGKMDYIRRVGAEVFSLGVEPRGHPEKFALMDANGKMVGLYTWSDENQFSNLENDIAKLVAAGGVMEGKESH